MEFLPSGGIKLDVTPPAGGMGMPAQPATTGAALARIGLPTLARETDLRRAAMLTPEESAANQAAETSPAARAQMEAAILEERDPAKRAILQSAFQQDFGGAPQGGMMRVSQPVQAPRPAPVAQRAPTWDEVVQHPSMQKLSADDMEKARNQYFLDVVAPTVRTVKDLRAARAAFDADTGPKSFVEDLTTAVRKSWETFKTSEQATAFLATGGDAAPLSKSIAADVAAQKDPPAYVRPLMQAVKEANDTQGFWQGLLGVGKVLYAGVTNPKATAYVTTENLANQIASLSGMVAGGVAGSAIGGPAGAIGGMALGALVGNHPEAGAKLVELAVSEAQKRKLDPRDPAAVQTVLDSPEFQAEARKQGLLKWAVVGGVDALTALVGAKMLTGPQRALQAQVTRELTARGVNVADKAAVKAALELPDVAAALRPAIERAAAASTTGQKALRAGGAFALETAGEGTGELLGEAAASGEWKPGEAALEAVASIGQSAGQTIASKALTAPGAIASVVRGGGKDEAPPPAAPGAPAAPSGPAGEITAADVLGPTPAAPQEPPAAPAEPAAPAAPASTPAPAPQPGLQSAVSEQMDAAAARAAERQRNEEEAALPPAMKQQAELAAQGIQSAPPAPTPAPESVSSVSPVSDGPTAKSVTAPTPAQQAQAGITSPVEGTAIAASSQTTAAQQPAAAKPVPANKLAPMQDARLKDENLLGYLKGVSDEAGWGEMGGKLIVDETNRDRTPGAGEVLGKTDWVGPEWWQIRPADARIPGDTNGSASREALRKALAGEPMRAVERRAVQFMLEEAQRRAKIDAEDRTAAGVDALPAEEQDDAIDVADDAVSLYADDWSAMSEEQREAELDAVFGKAPAQAEGRPTVPAGESGSAQAGPPETGPAGEAAGEVGQPEPAAPSPEGVAASDTRPGKRARPKPSEESQQEKSEREFRENYDRVSITDDLAQVSSRDLTRALSYASRKAQSEKRKGWDGGQVNQNLVQALDGEMDRIKRELKRRETPALDLTGQTRDEVAADAAKREEEAKRAAEEESKAKADAARGDFTLTGSDRAADEAAARGQGDLLAEPKPGEKIEDVGEKIGGARKDTATAGGPKRANASAEDTSDPAWRKRFVVAQIIKSSRLGENGRWIISDVRSKDMLGQPRRVGETFATKEDAEAAVPLVAVALKHRVYSARGEGYEIWRNVTDRKRVKVVSQTFETREDAMRYMATNAAEILEAKTGFGEEILPRPDKVRREGAKRRDGDATGQDFMDTFGFRAVEFGNWEAQDERQQVMNHAFDALMDLAEIIGVPPKALGLNGDLALAFGARGHGLRGSRAHYERDYGVINLTKMKGAGSLAHEWFHAADHYFGRQDGKAKSERAANERGDMVFRAESPEGDYVSHGFGRDSNVREELRASYKRVIDTMLTKAEQYVEDTKKAEEYVGKTRDDLRSQLNKIREDLAAQKDPTYWKKNNKPASAEQLAKFDELAEKLVQGEALETQSRVISPGKSRRSFGVLRMTNDVIEQLSAIYKEVRGRSGFDSTNRGGIFDAVTDSVRRYAQRVNHLESARASETKERRVPTSFSMEARTIDQGRTSDYWATPHEMAARAFQSYVEDKVADRGGRSDFLTYGTNMVVPTPWGWARPFPEGAERKAINAAFDDLFRVMQTKETDKGVALFSRGAFDTPRSDMGTNGLPRLANSTVVLGRTILLGNPSQAVSTARASLYDPKSKRLVGEAIFDFNRETSQIEALRWITVERQHRGKGYAEGAVRAILGYNAPDTELRLVSILDEAKSFWRRLGADFDAEATEPDGGITRGRFQEAGRTAAPAAQVGTDTARADAPGRRGAGPGPRTSQADQVTETPADAGVSASERVSAEIASRMGRPAEDLGAKVVGSIADLPAGLRSYVTSQNATDTQGVYDPSTGDVYLVATNIAPGRAFAVYLHELGVHKGMRALLGDERMGALAKQVRAWARGTGTIEEIRLAKIALARIPEGTPSGVYDEELLAYFVEEAVKAGHDIPQARPERGRLAQWLHDLWSAVRGALETLGVAPETLTASEVVTLARGAAERAIQESGGPFSREEARAAIDIKTVAAKRGTRHEPMVLPYDGKFAVVVDGRVVSVDESAAEAAESARFTDAEFWRGEFESFPDRWPLWAKRDGDPSIVRSVFEAPWYSALLRAVRGAKLQAAPAAQWAGTLKALPGVKADELEWSGVLDWLGTQTGKVTRDQVVQYLEQNGVRVEEVVLDDEGQTDLPEGWQVRRASEGDDSEYQWVLVDENNEVRGAGNTQADAISDGWDADASADAPTKYSNFQLPGGENYRELLLTLPEKDTITERRVQVPQGWGDTAGGNIGVERTGDTGADFRSSHFDQPNIVAHVRFNERTDADGRRVLFLEELQSDWAQKGRKDGFRGSSENYKVKQQPDGTWSAEDDGGGGEGGFPTRGEAQRWADAENARDPIAVPLAPFVTKTEAWVSLALKRMIRYGSEHGFDAIAWATGEQQAARYDLSKQISKVRWDDASTGGVGDADLRASEGRGILYAYDLNGNKSMERAVEHTELPDLIGKEAAERLLNASASRARSSGGTGIRRRELAGLELKVGGEGMKSFYDRIVPAVAKDVLKKLGGGQIEDVTIPVATMSDEDFQQAARADDNPSVATVRGFTITPELRAKAMQGMPLFSRAGNAAQQQAQRRVYRDVAGSVLDRVEAVLDPLHNLPDKAAYLKSRYLALGKIGMVDELAKGIRETFANATPEDRRAAYEYLTTADATPDGIQGGRTRARAVEVKGQINYVGDQLVARGLLSEETREAHRDAYLPRLYLKHLLSEQDFRALGTGRKPSDMGYLKQRKDIPEEVRKAILGEIEDPGFLSAVAIAKPVRDMALLDWLSQIATNKDWVLPKSVVQWRGQRVSPMWLKSEAARIRRQIPVMQNEANAKRAREIAEEMDQIADDAVEMLRGADLNGWKQMPNTPRFGRMRGIWVRSEIYDDMMGVNDFLPTDPGFFQSLLGYGGIGTKATQLWKMSKVALNPPAQVRNFISNAVLLQLSGVPLARVPQRVIQAFREIANDGPHWKVAKKYGVTESTFSTQELFRFKRELLDLAHNEGKLSPLGQLQRIAAIVGDFASDLYQKAEAVFKTAKIIDAMEREGKSESEAALEAQKWLFDYSLVHREVRYLRNAPIGMPFLTFQAKVLPRLIEVATLHPMRLLPWVALSFGLPVAVAAMLGVSGDDLEKLRKALPEWLQKRGHAYILPYQDADGRWQAIDLGYFFPWSMFTQLAGDIGRGEPMEALGTVGLFSGPVTDVIVALKTNKDPFTKREIAKPGDPPGAQMVSIANYVWDMLVPPIISSKGLVSPMWAFDEQYGGKAAQVATGSTNKYGDPKVTGTQTALYPVGVNLYSLEPDHTRAANLSRMKFELDEVRRELGKRLQNRGLSAERRQEIIDEYRAEMERRVKKIQEYAKESEVPPKLRARTGTGG